MVSYEESKAAPLWENVCLHETILLDPRTDPRMQQDLYSNKSHHPGLCRLVCWNKQKEFTDICTSIRDWVAWLGILMSMYATV